MRIREAKELVALKKGKFMKRRTLLASSALCPIALLGLSLGMASPAFGQDTPAQPTDNGAATSGDVATVETLPQNQTSEAPEEDIVVVGSRLRHNEFTSPNPVTIIDPELAEKQGIFDTAELIQSSTIAAGSTQITSAISAAFVTDGGEGANTVSLRGLGATRTLVLLNGRRAGPAGTRGAVSAFDLNVLPQSIIQNVEILKSGASSVYGSDAIAGVVNLTTKRSTDGIEVNGFGSIPFDSGGETYNVNAAWGKDFGNGHILIAGDYWKRSELKLGDRKYLDCSEAYIFKPGGRQRADLVDPRTGKYKCEDVLWGQIWVYDYQYIYSYNESNLNGSNGRPIPFLQFDYPGDNLGSHIPPLAPALDPYMAVAPPGWFPVGYDTASQAVLNTHHPFVSDSSFIPKTWRYTAYAQGDYDITDKIQVYSELLYNRRKTYTNAYRQVWQSIGFTENSTLPWIFFGDPSPGDPLSPGFTGDYLISPTAISDWFDSWTDVKYARGVVGSRGDLGLGNWQFDTYLQYSKSKGEYGRQVILNDAVSVATFRTGSCEGTTLEVSGRPCIDIPWTDPNFLAGQWTQQEKAFLEAEDVGHTKYTQWAWEGSANGTVVTLPAGDLQAVFGLTWRKDQLKDVPGEVSLADNLWNSTGSGITWGETVTKEAFGELEIPLIHNTPGIQRFSLSAAGRLTNVKTTRLTTDESDSDNGNWTYRLGANWEVTDWLRFRGSYGTSFRSPAIFEQVLEQQTGFLGQRDVDPCIQWGRNLENGVITPQVAANCDAQGVDPNHTGQGSGVTIISGGGLGHLKAETSTAKSASIILTPTFDFLPDTKFNLAVDWFDIKVKGEVTQLGANNIVLGCVSSDFFPDEPLCDLYSRIPEGNPGAGNIISVQDDYLNISSQRNKGFDVTANVIQDIGKLGKISLLAQMTWQTKDDVALFPGTNVSNNGEDGEPKWVGDFRLVWNTMDGWSFFYGLDVIGATSDQQDYIDANGDLCGPSVIYGEYCVDLTASSKFYHSISVTKEISHFEITAGVTNLFDSHPPRVSTGTFNGGEATTVGHAVFSSQYDYIGRRVFVNVKAHF